MGTIIVKRPLRRPAPDLPSGDVVLDPPPENPPPAGKSWTRVLMILPMLAGTGGMALLIGAGRSGPLMYVAGGLYGVAVLGMILFQIISQNGQGPSKQEMIANRRRYMRRLSQLRAQVRDTIDQQRKAMFYRHPDPSRLWSTAQSARLWERRPGDWDFTVIRIGLGSQELATPLVPPETKPIDELEPLCAMALRKFVTTYSTVPDLPVAVALRGFSRIYLTGDDDRKRAIARALVAQLGTFHAPGDVLTAFCVRERELWDWAKWLPHALHPTKTDAVGQIRLVAPSVTALEAMLDDVVANRPRFNPGTQPIEGSTHVVVFVDGGDTGGSEHLMIEGGVEGVTVIDLSGEPPRLLDAATLVLDISPDGNLTSRTMDGAGNIGTADGLGVEEMRGLVRTLAPLRLSALTASEQPLSGSLELTDLLGLGDPYEFDLAKSWETRSNRDRLRVPIGITADGRPMELDLKESAQDGMGPHGLLVGATGSGKSELLRTLVLALAVTHDSEILNFVLVDFKGGATFTKLDRLPHTSAVITNLADELHLVDRMLDAIGGELVRRQELLRKAGNYGSQRDYEKARTAGAPLDPLPALLIVVDEFSELLTARPDFIDMFVQIGRVGRSLGVHLLLASQRLEEGRLRGLDSHLSYRIALRTFSAMESRVVLGTPDAFQLPRSPGNGFLKTGVDELTRFKAAYVSGVHRRGTIQRTDDEGRQIDPVQDYSTAYLRPRLAEKPVEQPQPAESDDLGETLMDVLVERLEGQGVPAHQVWLPPLAEPPSLDKLLEPLVHDPQRGITTGQEQYRGALHAAAGIIDRPADQRRDVCWLDLSGAGGNIAVVGGPQSGKSTVIRTIIGSLALTHTPAEVQFFCLDFGGGGLTAMRDLAHVGGVATRRDVDRVRRSIAEARTLLAEREQRFAEHGIDGMATYRKLLREGRFPEDRFGDLFLVIDGWATVRAEFEDLEPGVTELLNRGLAFGIHVIASSNRWLDLRMNVRDMFGSRIELRLGDPVDSVIGRRQAAGVPEQSPGRGLSPDAMHFLSGVPRIDGQETADGLADGVQHLVETISGVWTGKPAPRVRLLPDVLPYAELPAPDEKRGIPIGISETDLQPVHLDFVTEPHLVLFGDVESGKSTFLRALAKSIMARYTPDEAQIALIDFRRSMLGLVPDEYLIGYATTSGTVQEMTRLTIDAMQKRLPGGDITPEQLRSRSWWSGPELFILVDDYDLVAPNPHDNPLTQLLEFMTQGRDIGLHLIVTRRIGGAARAMYDPVIARIRDLASPGILMSGSREEGPLLGNIKPQKLPPGRGWFITRGAGARLVQLAHLPADE
ncbi:type VII secretion protein EccCa [Amycolatopsis sp. NPDC006131]|uniref:type VII secretion protein EccCa n=1 Tax=Amycolatopsis sp. NPDC006131 TaxID=3156731 RepID=UPI0033B7D6C4